MFKGLKTVNDNFCDYYSYCSGWNGWRNYGFLVPQFYCCQFKVSTNLIFVSLNFPFDSFFKSQNFTRHSNHRWIFTFHRTNSRLFSLFPVDEYFSVSLLMLYIPERKLDMDRLQSYRLFFGSSWSHICFPRPVKCLYGFFSFLDFEGLQKEVVTTCNENCHWQHSVRNFFDIF